MIKIEKRPVIHEEVYRVVQEMRENKKRLAKEVDKQRSKWQPTSYTAVGKIFGITKQRVEQIVKKVEESMGITRKNGWVFLSDKGVDRVAIYQGKKVLKTKFVKSKNEDKKE